MATPLSARLHRPRWPASRRRAALAGGRLDLVGVSARPGEVLDLIVTDAPGAHAFVVQGSQPGLEYLVRLRVPSSGQVGLLCTTPGHENLHGNITVGVTE